jgi:hypothetical protein
MGEIGVKRFVAMLALVVLPVLGFTSSADAVGYGACTITGTITFSTRTLGAGTWNITPAVLDCQGIIAARRRITGRGPFRGSGSFTAVGTDGGCLRQFGTGKVDYKIPTSGGDILVSETENHTLGLAGAIDTPTLHGLFQLPPPYDGDCVTKPVARSTFVAQVVLVRYPREAPTPPHPNPVPMTK